MHLFTKEIDNKLFKQYPTGDEPNQVVVAKIFNPYGRGVWYLLNSDPQDPDYIWAIIDLFEVETGSVSRKELEELRVPPFNLGLERDLYFPPISAKSLYEGLKNGKTFADGGTLATTEVITDKNGEAWLFPNNPDGKDFGVRLADGGEVDEDYHSAFRKYIEYKFRGKNYNGWTFYVDNLTGTFYWIKDNVEVMATPFYDGYDALPIDIIKTENGDPLYQDTLEFNPTNVLEVDEKRYFALLSSYFMVVDGQEFKKGGKMPIIRTQFEEEEFEYADGGRIKGMNNATGESYGVVIGSIKKADDDLEGATKMNVRTSYQSRISEEELIFDKNGNLYQITDFGYGLEGNYPDTSAGSGHTYNADKKETLQVLSKKYNPSFAKKLIELAKDKKYANGGQTTIVDEFGSMSFRNQYDERKMIVIAKELEKDGGYIHKFEYVVSARDNDEAKKMATELWEKGMGNSDMHIVKVMSEEAYKFNPDYMGKYADGGMTDWEAKRKEIDDRNMIIRFKIASIIGLDKAIEYLERDYVISPFRLIEAAVSKKFITIDEIDEKLWDAARYEADDIDSSYRDSGEGIGSSDINAFVSYMLNDAGIKVGVVDGRYTRMANGGMMAKGGDIEKNSIDILYNIVKNKDSGFILFKKEATPIILSTCYQYPDIELTPREMKTDQFINSSFISIEGEIKVTFNVIVPSTFNYETNEYIPEKMQVIFSNLFEEERNQYGDEVIGYKSRGGIYTDKGDKIYDGSYRKNGLLTTNIILTNEIASEILEKLFKIKSQDNSKMAKGGEIVVKSPRFPYTEGYFKNIKEANEFILRQSKYRNVNGWNIEEVKKSTNNHKMAKGGVIKKSTFKDKVKAISARLEGTKVKAKYKGKYGATYDKKEAKEAASKIVGKIRANYGK